MRFQVFDVGHGFCALLTADNGNLVLFDCGHSDSFRPSVHLAATDCTAVDALVITNFDHDHVSDLPNLLSILPVQTLYRNRTIPTAALVRLKLEGRPLSPGLQSALYLHNTYTADRAAPLDFAGVQIRTYCNSYPVFTDTNNLSMATFLFYDSMGILVPGDLERPGWLELLKRPEFRVDLARTQILVASHHGRESGFCAEAFACCSPDIVVISDEAKQYASQENTYSCRAKGLQWSDGSIRRVLTTRRDGHITVTKQIGLPYVVRTSKLAPPM
ncbi:MAG: ComEC/Rec2 family competence protein [Bryobacteraceae bacterium]|jgi:beta-lactamase superfamily II metal-dependent hydrolase